MKCPRCSSQTRVLNSREGMGGVAVRRRRECDFCEERFSTLERVEESMPCVLKKSGHREAFNREKVLSGLRRACEKRPVSESQMERVLERVEAEILGRGLKELESREIGEALIRVLGEIDEVACVRFASVCREFSEAGQFRDVLRSLKSC